MLVRLLPTLAAISGFAASVEAGLPTDPGSLDAIGKWPLTVVLGAVCVCSIYLGYRQAKENAEKIVQMAEGEREANALRAENYSKVTSALAERNASTIKELAENHAKEMRTLLDEFVKKDH